MQVEKTQEERKIPAVGDSTGRSFAWDSVKKLLVSMLAVSMVPKDT